MPGLRTNGYRSHSRDERPKPRVASDAKILAQYNWRRDSLKARFATHGVKEISKKNAREVISVFGESSHDAIVVVAKQILES
jgi:hypothetical protein